MKLIRKSQLNLNYCTKIKKSLLSSVIFEYNYLVNEYIKLYWKEDTSNKMKFLYKEYVDKINSHLSYRMKKLASKKSIEIINSVKNKQNKNKSKSEKNLTCKIPYFKSLDIPLNLNFLKIENNKNAKFFDTWIHLSSLGQKVILDIPTKRHKHINNLIKKGYFIKNSGNLRLDKKNKLWLDVILEKEVENTPLKNDNILAIDLGINKLYATSERKMFGEKFKTLQNQLHNKKYLSKSWCRKNKEIKQYIQKETKKLNLEKQDVVVLEDLRKINKNTRGKLNKTTRKYLSFWNRQIVYLAINNICQENRVRLEYVKPNYTSQICSICNSISKYNRQGEIFKCISCGYTEDADINGAMNIRNIFTSKYEGNLLLPFPKKTS